MLLTNKNAVIYGAGGAIAGAVARAFAREGAKVFLAGDNRPPIDAVAMEIAKTGGVAEAAQVDALDGQAVEQHSISDEDIARDARAYSVPGRMAAAMGTYRAFVEEEKFGKERRGPRGVPITLVAGSAGLATLLPAIAQGLRDAGARSVAVETVADSGHYVIDEKPAEVAALIERYGATAPTLGQAMERK